MATERGPSSRRGLGFPTLLGALLAVIGGGLARLASQSDRQDIWCGYNQFSFGCHSHFSIGLDLMGMGLIILAVTAWFAVRRGD